MNLIPCRLVQDPLDTNDQGWLATTCTRCHRAPIYSPNEPSKWIGEPVACGAWPEPHELGHWLTLLLAAVCIRKEGYLWLKRKLGLAPKCGCAEREARLNRFVAWVWTTRNKQWQ